MFWQTDARSIKGEWIAQDGEELVVALCRHWEMKSDNWILNTTLNEDNFRVGDGNQLQGVFIVFLNDFMALTDYRSLSQANLTYCYILTDSRFG